MDTTEAYIKMCDWTILQEKLEPKQGDWCIYENQTFLVQRTVIDNKAQVEDGEYFLFVILGNGQDDSELWQYREECIILPRQHQLQEMLPDDAEWRLCKTISWKTEEGKIAPFGEGKKIVEYLFEPNLSKDMAFVASTPKQALVQGIMWELHEKKWNGDRWV